MPPFLQAIAALVLTYWFSRAFMRAAKNHGTPALRLVGAHVASFLLLSLLAAWFERSPSAFLPYLPAQLFWLVVDKVREQPTLLKRRKSRHRSSQSEGDALGRVITGIVALLTAAYVGIGGGIYAEEAISYGEVYVSPPFPGLPSAVRTDAVYALGKPDFGRASESEAWRAARPDTDSEWLYKNRVIRVKFNQRGSVTSIGCQEEHPMAKESCLPTLGVTVGVIEDELYDILGAPNSVFLLPDGKKIMRYTDIGHDFMLEQFEVKSIRLYPDHGGWLRRVPRFLIWLLP